MFHTVLIANRGEIAVRIAQTLQQMGIRAVGVFSDPDRRAPHVRACDEAYPLTGSTSAETYLRGEKIIDIARQHGVDAIHPGYGFLSENAGFARACADAGLVFIGPSPETIRDMGDKIIAKERFAAAGVPVVPGWAGDADADAAEIAVQAEAVGYPVLIKAAAGGGGKGMRVVHKTAELPAALEAAQREAQAAFGDSRVFIEKYIARPRHVEVQIFGDTHGHVVHLFERECSIQRRHQKIIEESPSPALTPELRERMCQAAVTAAKAIGYVNAGTVEFMLDDAGNFYFLEVNTRLQVEHPVTELVTHRDLVRAQVWVAAGKPLPFRQEELRQDGWAVECRVYAEDAARNFLPSIGRIGRYVAPCGPGIRVDSGIDEGGEVTVHYDPMLAKVITVGRDRNDALQRMDWALSRYVILGVTTNIDFLRRVIGQTRFQAGRIHTHFLEENPNAMDDGGVPDEAIAAAALIGRKRGGASAAATAAVQAANDPWQTIGAWRGC